MSTIWAAVTPANEQDRAQVQVLAEQVQHVTGNSVQVAFVDQGYTGNQPEQAAEKSGMDLVVVKLPEAKKGFVLLPKRWVWNAVSRGCRAFVVWHAISSGCPKR